MNKETEIRLKRIVQSLPETPGCYQYLDKEGTIIYVGKAKNLKRRVSSYFNREHASRKTMLLVNKIEDIRYVVVNTEQDALLLENNLIKKHKPHYNVLLKDDKTYPSICISNEYFPRVYKTRQTDKKTGTYFGPYSHAGNVNAILTLIKKLYHIRTCNKSLTPENIGTKQRVCLEYHINKCKAPCVGYQSHNEYMKDIEEIKQILNGNSRAVSKPLYEEMCRLAENLQFEEAQKIKEKYEIIEAFRIKSEVVSPTIHNVDVFSIEIDEQTAYINYLHIASGCINQAFTFEYKKKLEESKEDLLELGIVEMRERYQSTSEEIVVPFPIEIHVDKATITIPQKGDKKHLLTLSEMNVKQYIADRQKQKDKLNPEQKATRLLKEIQDLLKLDKLPIQIECFDNSNISGTDAVAACVVFKMGVPSKKDYRKYNIRTVVGPDDYASMREVVHRRYTRMINESQPLPNLIITDGGKGQMEAVRQIIYDELNLDIPIAGLAKDNRHRTSEILFGFPPITIGLKQDTHVFHFFEKMQDEVHRFAITFHRDKRSKSQIKSILDDINGLGPKRKQALLNKFKNINKIKKASFDELKDVVGNTVATNIKATFAQENNESNNTESK